MSRFQVTITPGCRRVRRVARRRGFTLLEVLIALAIFAVAAVVLASAYLNILNGYEVAARANQSDADVTFARSLVLQEPDREKVEQGGEFETANGSRVRWSAEIASTNTADLFAVTFTCEVTIPQGQGGTGQPETTVQRFTVLRPTWSVDTAERDRLREEAKTRIAELQSKEA